MKRQPTERKKIFSNRISEKGLISKIYKEPMQWIAKNQTGQLRNRQRIWIAIFPKEGTYMANRYMKSCSKSLIIRKIQIKTMRYHLIHVRKAVNKIKTKNNKCWWVCGDKNRQITREYSGGHNVITMVFKSRRGRPNSRSEWCNMRMIQPVITGLKMEEGATSHEM